MKGMDSRSLERSTHSSRISFATSSISAVVQPGESILFLISRSLEASKRRLAGRSLMSGMDV